MGYLLAGIFALYFVSKLSGGAKSPTKGPATVIPFPSNVYASPTTPPDLARGFYSPSTSALAQPALGNPPSGFLSSGEPGGVVGVTSAPVESSATAQLADAASGFNLLLDVAAPSTSSPVVPAIGSGTSDPSQWVSTFYTDTPQNEWIWASKNGQVKFIGNAAGVRIA